MQPIAAERDVGPRKRKAVTSRHEVCCVVTSCCLEGDGKVFVSRQFESRRAAPTTRPDPGDGTGGLIDPPEPRRSPIDSINYITEDIDKKKN